MNLKDKLNEYYFSMSINELKLMNNNTGSPNVTYNSLLYLDIISFTDKCTTTYLSQVLHISKPAVTSKINELVAQGLITKTQSESDKRVFYLTLNNDVKESYLRYDKALCKAVEQVNNSFSKEEQEVFCKVLDKIEKTYIEDLYNEK